MATSEELAWAAGFFEGEGSVSIQRDKRRPHHPGYPVAQISNTDKEILDRFSLIIGVGSITGPKIRGTNKPIWFWQATASNFYVAVEMLYPRLGTRRRSRIDEVRQIVTAHWERKRYVLGSRPPITEGARAKMAAAKTGTIHSKQTRAKMAQSQQTRRMREKAAA